MEKFKQEAVWTVQVEWGLGSVDSGPRQCHWPAMPYPQYISAMWLSASLSHSFLTSLMHMGTPCWPRNNYYTGLC